MKETDIPTPALVIDLPTVKRNLAKMGAYVKKHKLALSPHTKTHKLRRMGRLQLENGATSLSVAKLGEAKVMAEVTDELQVAYPLLDPVRTKGVAELAKTTNVRVPVDSTLAADRMDEAAAAAGSTLNVMVDLDTGLHRTGLQTPEQTVELAKYVAGKKHLKLVGLFTYQGNVRGPDENIIQGLKPVTALIGQTLDLWKQHGLEAKIVTGGSTPSAYFSHLNPHLTEIRPGTYIYHDTCSIIEQTCKQEDCAARIVATVVSNAVPGKTIVDSGNKTLAMDRIPGETDGTKFGYGRVVEYPDALVDQLTEEHGRMDITRADKAPKLGERVHIIPNHICVCVNLQNQVWLKDENGDVESVTVDSRGLLT